MSARQRRVARMVRRRHKAWQKTLKLAKTIANREIRRLWPQSYPISVQVTGVEAGDASVNVSVVMHGYIKTYECTVEFR